MPKSRAVTLDACGKAVRTVVSHGKSEPSDIESIREGRLVLLGLIREFVAVGDKMPLHLRQVETAMHDLHPKIDYSSRASVIRDIADVCVTLEWLENGKARAKREKALEATLACEYLKDEFLDGGP